MQNNSEEKKQELCGDCAILLKHYKPLHIYEMDREKPLSCEKRDIDQKATPCWKLFLRESIKNNTVSQHYW